MDRDEGPRDDSDPSALTIEAARARIASELPRVTASERVTAARSLGRVAAHDLTAPSDVPRFRAAAMDGYALRHAERGEALVVVGRSLAGHPSEDRLPARGCVHVTTGARVPDDADTVVQHEDTAREGDVVRLLDEPVHGLNVRAVGSDSARGDTLLARGTRLRAADLGLLAAHGVTGLDVLRPLRVALLSTGDELIDAGAPLAGGQIHDANRALLTALLADPAIALDDLGICADSPAALERALARAAHADVLVSSGGVSVGEADHVRAVIGARGRIALWKIAMKPGRPLTFGTLGPAQAFFGLPGNPVSAALTTLVFVRPALRHMLGLTETTLPSVKARLVGHLRKRPGRVEYQRGVLSSGPDGAPTVTTTGLQDSHVLRSLQLANCLIELPIGSSGAADGESVATHPFVHFGEAPV